MVLPGFPSASPHGQCTAAQPRQAGCPPSATGLNPLRRLQDKHQHLSAHQCQGSGLVYTQKCQVRLEGLKEPFHQSSGTCGRI